MINIKKNLTILVFSIFCFIFFTPTALAAEPHSNTGNSEGFIQKPSECENYNLTDLFNVLLTVVNYGLGIIGSICLLFIMYGGFVLITAGQGITQEGGASTSINKGKDIIVGAIIGLLIVLASTLIIQFTMDALGITDDWRKVPKSLRGECLPEKPRSDPPPPHDKHCNMHAHNDGAINHSHCHPASPSDDTCETTSEYPTCTPTKSAETHTDTNTYDHTH